MANFEIMKILVWLVLMCLVPMSAHAAESIQGGAAAPRIAVSVSFAQTLLDQARERQRVMGANAASATSASGPREPFHESALARAIEQAAHKGIVERSVEGYTDVLIQCQKSRLIVLTTPFMRSDSQQAHCYRY
ncbi:MAG: hypothetical protein V4582_03045 [Pseudomonadota bacterium]